MRTLDENEILNNPYTRLNLPSSCMGQHNHTFFEFNIVENGMCYQSVNNGIVNECTKGEVHLIRPYETHDISFSNKNSVWRDIYIKVDTFKQICSLFGNDFYNKILSIKEPLRYKTTSEEFNIFQKKIARLSQMLLNKEQYVIEIDVIYKKGDRAFNCDRAGSSFCYLGSSGCAVSWVYRFSDACSLILPDDSCGRFSETGIF